MTDKKDQSWRHPQARSMIAVKDEIFAARGKFPDSAHLMIALMEEVGELAEACLKHGSMSREARAEAIQVACVAIRIFEEGDTTILESVE